MTNQYTIRRYINHQLAFLEQPDGRCFTFGHNGEVVREAVRNADGTLTTVRGESPSAECEAASED